MGYTHYWENITATAELAKKVRKIIKTSDVTVCSWDGTGKPEVRADKISFDGSLADGDDYETFYLDSEDASWQCCKTGERPYDEVVTATLVAAVLLNETGKAWIDSDGSYDDWADGIDLYERAFGELSYAEVKKIQGFIKKTPANLPDSITFPVAS